MSLFKYLPSQYLSSFLDRGEIHFRNLTYFRQHGDLARGDVFEGFHRDFPGTDVTLETLDGRLKLTDKYAFHSTTNTDLVFVFCLSTHYSTDLLTEFSADACVEIVDEEEFLRRIRRAVSRMASTRGSGVLAGPVKYYDPAASVTFDIKDPRQIVFAKDRRYSYQQEFRVAFGVRGAFKLVEQIVHPAHDPATAALEGTPASKLVGIGSIRKLARVARS